MRAHYETPCGIYWVQISWKLLRRQIRNNLRRCCRCCADIQEVTSAALHFERDRLRARGAAEVLQVTVERHTRVSTGYRADIGVIARSIYR